MVGGCFCACGRCQAWQTSVTSCSGSIGFSTGFCEPPGRLDEETAPGPRIALLARWCRALPVLPEVPRLQSQPGDQAGRVDCSLMGETANAFCEKMGGNPGKK